MGLGHSTCTDFVNVAPFSDTSYGQNGVCPGNMPTSQRQQAVQQLYIDTRLSPSQFDDREISTASSSSLRQVLQTPCSQSYPSFQSSVHKFSPQSASMESGMMMPDFEKSPFPVSPLSPYSPAFEEDAPTSSLPMELEVMTQSPMPHILKWKEVIEHYGTNDFIPQTVYTPYTEADKKRYILDVELRETIFFHSDGSSEFGISLDDALKQQLMHMKDKDDRMFVGCGPSVSIRIQWPGYPSWSKQIPTMDFKTPKGPITRAKLAKNIATCLRRFVQSVKNKPMEADSDRRWKVGERQHIRVEDLVLVSLHHVSKGSWQPQLRLRRPISTLPCRRGLPVPIS
ncbi:hypothetical protein L210DRAFT_3523883 [Boletus edulis BED1]|uniref:Uncharacterized protein n=1 Tax=Boletus edulis BED1 TaxID=1328754 RepID=A0AAD4C5S7_BOLED|nr:hypothetical protein L210DRAFT_3523883 [Boletus edulis BED1]